jgi:cytochrome c oxidase assembly protein subunit 11
MPAACTERRSIVVAASCGAAALAMVGLAYAAVPLYRLFCQATGYGGTTQRAQSAPPAITSRELVVEFDANRSGDLPWTFMPVQRRIRLRVGQEGLAYYRARNDSDAPVSGAAVFNVTPDKAGRYFSKIECFCFVQQTLQAGETADMPVVFFIDPEITKDRDLEDLKTITLSYTFYPAATADALSAAPAVTAASAWQDSREPYRGR